MKTLKYSNKPELPVFHFQQKTKDGYLISLTSEEKPEAGDVLETWERKYIIKNVLEERISTQDYGQGVR